MNRHASVTKAAAFSLVLSLTASLAAQQMMSLERQRARPHYRAGHEYMRIEAWAEAAKSFQQAIDIDREFEDAYYGLGRANMNLKKYDDAISAYARCRDLYRAYAGKHFSNQQDAQRYRQDRLAELDDAISQTSSAPQLSLQAQNRLRQMQDQRRQLQLYLQRGQNITIENSVPAFVYLALGSAYFRSGKLADAEREYKAAIVADPATGEAHSNLAVVYLETGRYADADRAVAAAERAGHKVNPQLKKDIRDRAKGT
jgi:tetratricopeptide (TPR) repeat protein